jgi:Fe-S-cluster containining protein
MGRTTPKQMGLLPRVRSLGKPVFSCQRCGTCCHNVFPLFLPDLSRLERRVNLSKIRKYTKVYLSPGHEPPKGIRIFLDSGDADRLPQDKTVCPFLGEGNACAVYEDRPIACRRFPVGDRIGSGTCTNWNGKPDPEMASADKQWKEEEKKISKMGADAYYRRWLSLLYPKGYIPPAYIRKGMFWTTDRRRRP